MFLSELSLRQFKNYRMRTFRFNPKINIFYGSNGAGKTNVLDALHYLSVTKSYFNSVDHQQILRGEQYFVVEGKLNTEEIEKDLRLVFQRGIGKSMQVNNNELEKFSEHFGTLPVVMIAPGDIQLIYEGSEERRKFVDMIIAQCDRVYLHELGTYQRALDQRNKLLRDFYENRYRNRELLDVYNEQLGKSGTYIFSARTKFMEQFKPLFLENYKRISTNKEQVNLSYESDLSKTGYPQILQQSEQADFDLLRTTKGIHKDDYSFMLEDQALRKFGSQGQQKSYIISLKLAQFQYLEKTKGFKPLLLLDDIFEKLDLNRLKELFHWMAQGEFGQVFVTDTQQARLEEMVSEHHLDANFFEIVDELSAT